MTDRFAAAKLKIERAEKHIADLDEIVCALSDAYTSTIEPNEKGGETIKYLAPNVPKVAAIMALIIGDALHNLRVAVEYAYLGAVEKHASTALDAYTKFPTGETREDVESRLRGRKIDVLSAKLFDRIVSDIKPYVVGGNCLIKFLHDLDVSDKHWLLTPLVRKSWISGIVVQNEKGEIVTGDSYPIPGDETFFFDFGPGCKVKDKGKIAVEVVFDDFYLLRGMPVLSGLKDFSKLAAHIIRLLEGV